MEVSFTICDFKKSRIYFFKIQFFNILFLFLCEETLFRQLVFKTLGSSQLHSMSDRLQPQGWGAIVIGKYCTAGGAHGALVVPENKMISMEVFYGRNPLTNSFT